MSGDNRLRGITCPDMTRVVREALANGWEWVGVSGTTHAQIRWPASGDILRFGTTPSVASWKSLAADIKRVSGVEVWRKGNRKRSRKAFRPSGFTLTAPRESAAAGEIDRLIALHEAQRDEWERLVTAPSRNAAMRARELMTEIDATEGRLRRLHQPIEGIYA
jgi:hypothetical protein